MRKKYIAGNWKMHKTASESVALADALAVSLAGMKDRKIMIAPAFTALSAVGLRIAGSGILLGAQNMGPEEQGAHTGEVSVLMLKDLGVQAVILGHSERRHTYLEGDGLVNRKLRLALRHGLEVILCVGETQEERDGGVTRAVVERQLGAGLEGVVEADLSRITVAYEPVWAIGTGKTATPADADEVHFHIRSLIAARFGKRAAEEQIIQYGGSVKPANAAELMSRENIDGFLVGGAALSADSFVPIVRYDRGK
ncbi:MAG: triose-phosphate isomerase [Spirochaetes bacterium RBG_16_67_19]|nr:MAG: triose-phosphate isomerase [Spirochaetes bacterium RBG_16_67_19]